MAELVVRDLAHTYVRAPSKMGVKAGAGGDADWVLDGVSQEWGDGGAFALLGPSGCGKTTLLNLLSGLLTPSRGRILFDGKDVVGLSPQQRNIAQVFQFPVVYDTMSVRDNLAFPLRNRGVEEATVARRVGEVAEALELGGQLERRAAALSADMKQKISLGRGLVRTDVSAILLDEPLTVIDPELKWQLRSNLKALHRRFKHTMVYVTHDQTEALTFAERIMVMHGGRIVQEGSAVELFAQPRHKFVGHFIGSPGMNFAACSVDNGSAVLGGVRIELAHAVAPPPSVGGATVEIGIRPEFVRLERRVGSSDASDGTGVPVKVERVTDIGHNRIAEFVLVGVAGSGLGVPRFKAVLAPSAEIPADARACFNPAHTFVYYDGWLAGK